jgi:hypothetical protein
MKPVSEGGDASADLVEEMPVVIASDVVVEEASGVDGRADGATDVVGVVAPVADLKGKRARKECDLPVADLEEKADASGVVDTLLLPAGDASVDEADACSSDDRGKRYKGGLSLYDQGYFHPRTMVSRNLSTRNLD